VLYAAQVGVLPARAAPSGGPIPTARSSALAPGASGPGARAGEHPIVACRLAPAPPFPKAEARPRDAIAAADTTPPSAVGNLQFTAEGMQSLVARWRPASDPESGISAYVFALGSAPGMSDIRWWQSVGTSLSVGGLSPSELGFVEGRTVHVSVAAINGAGTTGSAATQPLTLTWERLGDASSEITVDYAGDWRQGELDTLGLFVSRMLPIITEIYGPPSHSYTLTLVKDPAFASTNIFFSGPNSVHMYHIYPQLLTHELIHAWRDNVVFASDLHWRYSPVLSGFEESFAQGVSFACMNRYVERYPMDAVVPGNTSYGSSFDWDYDFENTDLVTTTDYWSDASGTGIFWLRYELGAAAILKVMTEYPSFPRDFNRVYYERLNADHALRPSRELARDIIRQVAPAIEGREAGAWVDRQRIFDCRVRPGRKIWVNTQHYVGFMEYLVFQKVYHYETFSNGSEWSHWDPASSSWRYHSLNGTLGHGDLRDWTGAVVWQKDLRIEPVENPPQFLGFGSAAVHLSTDDDTEPWPGGDPGPFALGLHRFGLYTLELRFGDVTTSLPRLMGDTLRTTRGVFGAVQHSSGGWISLDHAGEPRENPLRVVNGAFWGLRSWASLPNPRTGSVDSRPGPVHVTYVDEMGAVYRDQRNVDLGSWSGNQLFLFDTQEMARGDTVPLIAVEPAALDFGAVPARTTAWRTLAVTNTSPRELALTSATLRDPHFGLVGSTLPATIPQGDTLRLTIAFTPGSAPTFADTLDLDNSSFEPRLRVPLIGRNGTPSGVDLPRAPSRFELVQNYPNPFNPSTLIRYSLPYRTRATLTLYDASGKQIAILSTSVQDEGAHQLTLSHEHLAGGVYFYSLRAGNLVATRRLVLLK
jgi:hypothetical protein